MRAVVVLREGYEPSDELASELQEHVKRETAPYKYPRIVEFADELPKTASGKVKRAELRTNNAVPVGACTDRPDVHARRGQRRMRRCLPNDVMRSPRSDWNYPSLVSVNGVPRPSLPLHTS